MRLTKMSIVLAFAIAALLAFGAVTYAREAQPGDDHGGHGALHAIQLNDDHGGHGHGADDQVAKGEPQPGDDRGGHGGDDIFLG